MARPDVCWEDCEAYMSLSKDVFFRSHVVELNAKEPSVSDYNEPKWSEYLLIYDTETTLDPKEQALTFGWYRVCRSQGEKYVCIEEGIFHTDDITQEQLKIIKRYVQSHRSEVMHPDYDERIHIYSRSEFVEKVFFETVRVRGLISAFNAPWDVSRLSVDDRTSRERGWSLILSQRVSRKTGQLEANPARPRVRVTSKDSKAAFFSLSKPANPEEWPTYKVRKGEKEKHRMIFRVLDLRTLGWALFNESYSLRSACKALTTPNQKLDHKPSGTITIEELDYARQDVRCSVDVLNALKEEFDRHPIDLHPDKAVSPASVGKAYLRAMGITPPKEKFDVPNEIYGIAAQSYYGGRAECRIRHTPVPCVLTDITSEYPLVNSLLGNPDVLRAEHLTFDEATEDVCSFVQHTELDDCFCPRCWKQMSFFALVQPDEEILPVRAEYSNDGITKNIAVNYYSSEEPSWFTGPDVIMSKLLTGKVPKILKAIRMVPHGLQKGLKPVNLRGMVEVDPRKDDLFQRMVEQKQVYMESDPALSYFLKTCVNGSSYGMYFELTPQKRFKPVSVKVFSGEHSHEQTVTTIEKQGEFYFPPIAALITGGAHLLLAMIERCITDKGGHFLFMDTDSACVCASRVGGRVQCPGEPDDINALSWKEVERIAKRFESLNVYDQKKVKGSILKIEKVNFHKGRQIELYGYAISAKRYVLYRYNSHGNVVLVDAKAHGLGYLFPPKDGTPDDPETDWIYEVWRSVLANEVIAPRFRPGQIIAERPTWFKIPAMMRMTVSTPAVLGLLKKHTRPFNFLHVPLPLHGSEDDIVQGGKFTLVMPFSTDREAWEHTQAIDTRTGKHHSIYAGIDPKGRTRKVEVKTYGLIVGAYKTHPEAKFIDRNGEPCSQITRGLLRRSHIIANTHRYIGKETSRRWEQGDDMSMVNFKCTEYHNGKVLADKETRKRIARAGVRTVERETGIHHDTLILIAKGKPVKLITLRKVIKFLDEQKPKAKPFSGDRPSDLPDLKNLRNLLDPQKYKQEIAVLKRRINRLENSTHVE